MTTAVETLRPTGVPVGWGSGSGSAYGASPQWADDDDATGATRTIGSTNGGVAAVLPTLAADPSKVVGITAWIRMSCTASAAEVSLGFDEAAAGPTYIIDLSQDPDDYFFPVTSGATLATYTLSALHVGTTGQDMAWAAAQLAAGGIWISAKPLATGATITVVDLAVLVEYDATTFMPVARLWPRDDGRGISSAPRIVPAPKSNRVVGGYP